MENTKKTRSGLRSFCFGIGTIKMVLGAILSAMGTIITIYLFIKFWPQIAKGIGF